MPWSRQVQLNHHEDGSCVFLGADGRCLAQLWRAHSAIASGGDDREDAVYQRARDQGWQQEREHPYTVTSG